MAYLKCISLNRVKVSESVRHVYISYFFKLKSFAEIIEAFVLV
jgi:hypothetical protein